MNETVEHLKMIQGIINRMTQLSFLLKGWSVTLVVTLLAVATSIQNSWFGFIALVPTVIFWGLDAYYLRQERLFRSLYDTVRVGSTQSGIPVFSMDTSLCERDKDSWRSILRSPAICGFHVAIVGVVIIVSLIISLR